MLNALKPKPPPPPPTAAEIAADVTFFDNKKKGVEIGGFKANEPFYIVTRMKSKRVVRTDGNNLTIMTKHQNDGFTK